MAAKHSGTCGCGSTVTESSSDPIDVHTCHCGVCKSVTGQDTTHVAFFKHSELSVNEEIKLNRQPFNASNPDGPLELCTCADCGSPIMLDDKERRIRVIVPNLMGHDADKMPATYHAFFDASSGADAPDDGRPVHEGLQPSFVWPDPQ